MMQQMQMCGDDVSVTVMLSWVALRVSSIIQSLFRPPITVTAFIPLLLSATLAAHRPRQKYIPTEEKHVKTREEREIAE